MNTNTRSVSFVENLELEISDTLFNESLLLADVDNDEDYELVVGQINGDLLIFKGSSSKPWRVCHHLGMICCVGAGDLWNQGENLLFCITAEGWCHLFYVTADSTEDGLEPVSSQLLPSNCKVLLLADVDGDGLLKLVTGHADRIVHIHNLVQESGVKGPPNTESCESKNKKTLESSGAFLQATKQESSSRECKSKQQKESSTPSKDRKNSKQEEKDAREQDGHKTIDQVGFNGATKAPKFGWRFVSVGSWTVPFQINSLVVFDVMTTRYLLASQPGGTYVVVMSSDLKQQEMSDEQARACPLTQISNSPSSSIFNQLPVLWGRNKGIPTNLITLQCHDSTRSAVDQEQRYLVLCTQDGYVIFMNGRKHNCSLRVNQGNYNLFALSKLDVNQDGSEQVALCSWNGNTYIVDHLRNVVQFNFGENVVAFCAGCYAFAAGKNLPALVYVTSSNRIVIYYNARVTLMIPSNLDVKMKRKASQDKEARVALSTVVAGSANNNGLIQFYKECFYGKKG